MPYYFFKNAIPVLMIVASAATAVWFLWPQYNQIQALRGEKQEFEQAIQDANQARILRGQLLATYDSFSASDWDRLMKLLPDSVDGVQVVRDVSGIAQLYNLNLQNFSFQDVSSSGSSAGASAGAGPGGSIEVGSSPGAAGNAANGTMSVAAVPAAPADGVLEVRTSIQSSYSDFINFLQQLEKSLELVDVVGLNVSRASAANSTGGSGNNGASKSSTLSQLAIASSTQYQFDLTLHTYWLRSSASVGPSNSAGPSASPSASQQGGAF